MSTRHNDTQNKNRIEYKNDKWFYININKYIKILRIIHSISMIQKIFCKWNYRLPPFIIVEQNAIRFWQIWVKYTQEYKKKTILDDNWLLSIMLHHGHNLCACDISFVCSNGRNEMFYVNIIFIVQIYFDYLLFNAFPE